jgi:hypothetical protein
LILAPKDQEQVIEGIGNSIVIIGSESEKKIYFREQKL